MDAREEISRLKKANESPSMVKGVQFERAPEVEPDEEEELKVATSAETQIVESQWMEIKVALKKRRVSHDEVRARAKQLAQKLARQFCN